VKYCLNDQEIQVGSRKLKLDSDGNGQRKNKDVEKEKKDTLERELDSN